MTQDELRAWLELRCADDEIEFWLAELAGKTEAELEAMYEAMHGSMA